MPGLWIAQSLSALLDLALQVPGESESASSIPVVQILLPRQKGGAAV